MNTFDDVNTELPPYTLTRSVLDRAAALAPEAKKLAALPKLTTPLALPTRLVPPSRYSALPPNTLIVLAADARPFAELETLNAFDRRETRLEVSSAALPDPITTLFAPYRETRSLTDDAKLFEETAMPSLLRRDMIAPESKSAAPLEASAIEFEPDTDTTLLDKCTRFGDDADMLVPPTRERTAPERTVVRESADN